MNWKDTTIASILLLICRMITDDPALRENLKNLANHLSYNVPRQ